MYHAKFLSFWASPPTALNTFNPQVKCERRKLFFYISHILAEAQVAGIPPVTQYEPNTVLVETLNNVLQHQ